MTMMKKAQTGFTLIELMIVVAIIGILAAVALPAYQDYMARAKVSEVMARLDAAKTGIAEFVVTNGRLPTSTDEAGIDTSTTKYISAVIWDSSKGIQVTVQGTGTPLDSKNVFLAPSGTFGTSLAWTCGTDATTTTLKYLPSNCRGATPSVSVTS